MTATPVLVDRKVEFTYTPGVKALVWRVYLTPRPSPPPAWPWPDPLPVYVGTGDTLDHADAAALAAMKAVLG